MAYVSAEEGFGTAASVIHDDPAHPRVIDIPNAELLAPGHLHRAGPDLLLSDRDGKHYVIPGYFSTEHPPALVAPDGGGLPGDLVGLLTGSPSPNEYAQAQPTAPAGSIGKVEKVIGDVTAIRNGVAVALHVGDVVYQSDVIQTGVNSRVGIGFPDGTALELTADTRMALSEYSYDANSTSNSAVLTLVEGTFAFVAGSVAHTGDMKIATPVATMGIRGTTGYVLETGSTYQYVVVDDYASTRHGAYDLYEIDQNGNLVRDQNGLPIILATVSQTEFVTECSLTSCATNPMSASQLAFAQQIVPQLFQTYVLNNPSAPHTNPGGNGSSEPLIQPNEQQNPQLIQFNGTQGNVNTGSGGQSGGSTGPTTILVIQPPPPPPPPPTTTFGTNTLVEYYFYPNFGTNYFTSIDFVPPASDIKANPDLGGAFFLAVTDNSIMASDFTFNGTFTVAPFNGFEVVDLTGNPDISGVTIDASSNMVGLTSSDIFFDSNAVWVNWAGLAFNTGTVVKLDITFDPPLEPSQVSLTQTLDGSAAPASNTHTLTVSDGTELALLGTIDNSGVIAVDGAQAPTAIGIDGNVTLQGGGQIVLSDSDQNYIFGHGILTNVDDTISGGGDIGNGTLVFHNEGVVEAQGAYALIVDTGTTPFVNTGTIEANGGTLIVDSPVTGGGNAVIAGGTIEFTGASDNNVSFNGGSAGMLALDQSQQFTGHIAGFAGPDQIDLGDIGYSSNLTLNYTAGDGGAGGTLTVSDGSHTTSLDLIGDYTASSFITSSDGHGGTILADSAVVATADQGSSITANDNTVTGSIELTNFDPSGPENATVTPEGSGYEGSFALDTASESNGSTSVGWQFSLADDQINVAPNQTVTQGYDVSVTGPQGSAASQEVSVSIGGSGNDNFVFQPGVGADTIVNFNPQHDTIELDHFANAQTVQELQSLITPDAHGNAVIDLGHGDSVTLDGTTPAQLQAILQSAVHLH
jgi:hypothetical protein